MAITKLSANLLSAWVRGHGIRGRCLGLGRQDVLLTGADLKRLIDDLHRAGSVDAAEAQRQQQLLSALLRSPHAGAPNRTLREKGFVSDRLFFELLGFDEIKSLDASGFENADIVYDLNRDNAASVVTEPFDLLLETGTAEHVFHFPNFCKNVYDCLAVNGHAIHFVPVNNFSDHGFYQFSPTLFYDYYTVNRFDILNFCIVESESDDWSTGRVYDYEPGTFDTLDRRRFQNAYVLAAVHVRKTRSSTYGVIPQQRVYREKLDWSIGLSPDAVATASPLGVLAPPFEHESGFCWFAHTPPGVEAGDSANRPHRSRLLLLENNRLVGPPHALHEQIRKTGGGCYSHWQDRIYFSTSDNSDPNVNGKTYEMRRHTP